MNLFKIALVSIILLSLCVLPLQVAQAEEVHDLVNQRFPTFGDAFVNQGSSNEESKDTMYIARSFGAAVEVLPPDDWNDDYPNLSPLLSFLSVLSLFLFISILLYLSSWTRHIRRLKKDEKPIQAKKEA